MICYGQIEIKNKKSPSFLKSFIVVQAERLELSHLAALDPKSSVSTNSTTPAYFPKSLNSDYRGANITQKINSLNFSYLKITLFVLLSKVT